MEQNAELNHPQMPVPSERSAERKKKHDDVHLETQCWLNSGQLGVQTDGIWKINVQLWTNI